VNPALIDALDGAAQASSQFIDERVVRCRHLLAKRTRCRRDAWVVRMQKRKCDGRSIGRCSGGGDQPDIVPATAQNPALRRG
jgi:hypothetical protein